jgi:hypothetical protein
MAGVDLADTPFVWNFIQIVRHKEPLVLLHIPRLKMGRLIIRRGLISIK